MKALSLITAHLDRELVSMGFRRKNATWNREVDSLVEVIDIQISSGGNTATMNAGVLSRPIYLACWGRDAEPFVEEPYCTVRTRIGYLLGNKDQWWELGSEGVASEMLNAVNRHILPFLERMRSLEGMRDWLKSTGMPSPKYPLPSICYAVLQSQLGEKGAACTVLAELESKALGAWKARAQEVAMRIGCAPLPTRH